jgi:hypothetical protein
MVPLLLLEMLSGIKPKGGDAHKIRWTEFLLSINP